MSDTPKPEDVPNAAGGAGPAAQPADSRAAPGSAETPMPATPEARIAELEGQIADLTDRLLRAHADMDNMRKRTEKEKADTAKYAITKFAGDMIDVADNFQRARAAVPAEAAGQDGALKSLLDGVVMIERAFDQALDRHKVRKINPAGEPFDPHFHQAVMEQQNPEVAAGTILQVYQVGYVIEDRLLRPAAVVVAKGGFKPVRTPEPAAPPQPANDTAPPGPGNGSSGSSGTA